MKVKCLADAFTCLGKFCRKNSSKLLTGATVLSIVATAVVSTKQGSRLAEKKAEAKAKGEELTKKEVVKTVAPTVVVTAVAAGCAIALYSTDKKKEAGLATALTMAVNRFNRFQKKVDEHDPNLKETINKEIMEEDIAAAQKEKKSEKFTKIGGKDVIFTTINEGEPVLCYDNLSNKYFYSSVADLRNAMYEINRRFQSESFLCVNDYFEHFGLPEEDYGWSIGWMHDEYVDGGIHWIDIDISKDVLADGLEVIKVEVLSGPWEPDTGLFVMTGTDETQPGYFTVVTR